ncbi:MAG TPA: hypothetical protein VFD90_21090 [Gaiellales bacterium]|jgi:hypothetical protein|nr:hypothetical protein [Gaiellales bacterium]
MQATLQALWARASVCLLVSPIGFIAGGALLFAAVDEIYGSDGHEPRGWLVIALTVCGWGVFGLGAATWLRACQLVLRRRRQNDRLADPFRGL